MSDVGNWFHHLWFVWFLPSLQGNGPEDLLALILVGGLLTWLGRLCVREWRAHKAKMAEEHQKIHERLDRAHQRHDKMLAHLDLLHAEVAPKPANPPTPPRATKPRATTKKAT